SHWEVREETSIPWEFDAPTPRPTPPDRLTPMDQRISFVTPAVADLDATRRFYVDGLGWEPALDVPGEVLMIKAGEHLVLSLWSESGFEAEVGTIRRGEGVVPLTLAHNVRSREEVDEVLATARAAGGAPVHRRRER